MKKRNELLQQLMKDQDEETKLQEQQVQFLFISKTHIILIPLFKKISNNKKILKIQS